MEHQPQGPATQVQQLQRPPGNQPPTDRNFDDSYTLDYRSLVSIGPFQWLDDGVINTFLRSLCLARPGQYVALDSTPLQHLQTMLESESTAPQTQAEIDELYKTLRTLAATVTGNRGLVFMPFCIEDHWILAVADFESQVIRVYDSLVSCTETGMIVPSDLVERILPCVKGILSFCIDESQWAVLHMWLPIQRNLTECGVYVCLMALQNAHKRNFMPDDYVTMYGNADGDPLYYELEVCYWMAGRRVILEVCRRYFKPVSNETQLGLLYVSQSINGVFRHYYDPPLAERQTSQFPPYHVARYWTLDRVINALDWLIESIAYLGFTQFLRDNDRIQRNACNVVLTMAGEPYRNEIVEEAVNYAWHDGEALRNLATDLYWARRGFFTEFYLAQIRHEESVQAAHTAQSAQLGGPAEEARSAPERQSPYSPNAE